MSEDSGYRNEYLDKAVAMIVVIMFFVALFYAVNIISQYWAFFRILFCAVVAAVVVWIVVMLFSIVWRYNTNTQMILESNNVPVEWSSRRIGRDKPIIHTYPPADQPDYNSFFSDDDENEN